MYGKVSIALLAIFILSLGVMRPSIHYGTSRFEYSEFIFLLACATIVAGVAKRAVRFEYNRYYTIAAALFAAFALSAAASEDRGASLTALAGKLYLLLIPVVFLLIVRTEENFRFALKTWIGTAAAVAVVGVASIILFYADRSNPLLDYTLFHFGTLPPGNYPRLASTFRNANHLANYLNVAALITAISASIGVIGRRTAGVILAIIGTCALFTFSPGIGGFFLAAGLWYWLEIPRRPMIAVAATIAAIAVLAAATVSTAPQPDPLYSIGIGGKTIEPSARVMVWNGAMQTFLENPLTGRGVGLETCRVRYLDPSGINQTLTEAHNAFLNVAADSGLPGLVALIMIAIYFGSMIRSADSVLRGLAIAFICGLLYQGLTGSFEDARHLWGLMGLMAARERLIRKE